MKLRRYDADECAVIEQELARGDGWAERAAARLPHRTMQSIQTFASSTGMIKKHGRGGWGHATHAADHAQSKRVGPIDTSAYDRRNPPSTTPAADRTPVFLDDLFAKWRAS